VVVLVTSTVLVRGTVGVEVGGVVVGMAEVVDGVVGVTADEVVVGKVAESMGDSMGESMDATAEVSPPRGSEGTAAVVVTAVVGSTDGVGVVAAVEIPVPKRLVSGSPNCLR